MYPSISKCNSKMCSCGVDLLLNLTLMVDMFLVLQILILIEDEQALFILRGEELWHALCWVIVAQVKVFFISNYLLQL